MNPDSPIDPHSALESSLTALLLGELPHDQAAALHQKLAQDAELAKLYERLKHTINLVRETVASPAAQTADQPSPLKLSDRRREQLLQHFKTVTPKEFIPPRRRAMPWLMPVAIAAALVVVAAPVLLPHFTNRTRLMERAFGTWSLSESAGTTPDSAVVTKSSVNEARLAADSARRASLAKDLSQQVGEAPPPAAVPAPSKPAVPAIVLPKATELADATPTPEFAAGMKPGSSAASLRGFYDDSSTQAGGMGGMGGGGFGGGGGMGGGGGARSGDGVGGSVSATEGRQWGLAAAVEHDRSQTLGEPSTPPLAASNPSQTLEYKANDVAPILGPDGQPLPPAPQNQNSPFVSRYAYETPPEAAKGTAAGTGSISPARQYPDNSTIGKAYFSLDAETRRLADVGAQAQTAVPPPSAKAEPAQEALGKVVASLPAPVPPLAPAGAASAERGREVAEAPLQAPIVDETAGDLIAGRRAAVPSQVASTANNEAELLLRRDANGLEKADKLAEAAPAAGRSGLGNEPLYLRANNNAAATSPPPSQTPAPAEQIQQRLAGSALPPASSSFYAGGAYGGYSSLQKAPSGGGQGGVPARPALRSPKEGGVSGGIGGALPKVPSGPQVATVSGTVLSGADRLASSQSDQKALGFDWDQGHLPALNSGLAAQGGSAPTKPGQASVLEQKLQPSPTSEPAAAPSDMVPLAIKLPAPAFQGSLQQIPALGDLPVTGSLFQSTPGAHGSSTTATPGSFTTGQTKNQVASQRVKQALTEARLKSADLAQGQNARQETVGDYDLQNTEPSDVYNNLGDLFQRNKARKPDSAGGVDRTKASPIVLPPTQGETDVALNYSTAVEQNTRQLNEAQKKVDDLRSELSISDGMAGEDGQSPLMTAESLHKLESLRIESKAEYDRQSALLGRLKSLEKQGGPEALAQAIPNATKDTVLSSLLERQTAAEQKLASLEKNYGPAQPEVIKARGQIEDLHTKLKDRVDGIMLGLDARVAGLSNSLDNFEKEVEQTKSNDMAEANRTRPYFEAKRTLDELQRSRQNLAAKPASEKADVAPPKPATPAPVPQPEVQTADNAFSTFSLNVSDVSFKLAEASLEKGIMPDPATVRSEEFINAFDYRDPEPPPGVPVAFAWEGAQYPFAQNRDLLRFSIKTAALGRQPGRALNIVLLLDNSGSMERADRVRIIHEALRVLAGQLQPQDIFSVVTFSRTAHLWVDGVPGNQAAQVAEEVSGLTPQGGTNLEDAMNLAYQTALRHYLANGVNRVVLLTDGAANLGNVDPEALKQKVETNRKQGVALDCFGIGWEGYNDDLLEVLSRNGDGRYAFLNSPEEVASEFAAKLAGALQVAASDVKVQVEFNPARVSAYRQIGYAKHQLTKEQFRDNTVNAAQIGAAEAGNALYAVEVDPAGTGPLCTVRVRFRIPGTADYREHAWDVPYTGNAVALEQASPAMRLSATASAFSEWLASSPYAGEVTPDRLLGYLTGVPEVFGADARPKKLEWMIRQAKSIAGK